MQAAGEAQEKLIALFKFIRELNKNKQQTKLNIDEYRWHLLLKDIPSDPKYIRVNYADRGEQDGAEGDGVLLAVRKPEFTPCPEPHSSFRAWLAAGWEDYRKRPELMDKPAAQEGGVLLTQGLAETCDDKFDADARRVAEFDKWQAARRLWQREQRAIRTTRYLFSALYTVYTDLQRDGESLELVAANGFILDKDNSRICHPILTHRVAIDYDTDRNEVCIRDTNTGTELYTEIFNAIDGVNLTAIGQSATELELGDYHPLDRVVTPRFLRSIVYCMTDDSMYSEHGVPQDWQTGNRLLLYLEPCYLLRHRLDGTVRAINRIIDDIRETRTIPEPLRELVSGGKIAIPEDRESRSIEEQLAEVGGESADILLAKPANREQLAIARRIERYNAVLVQGPPGTGKTHTIANLLGHLLAQGKSVLVTSHTAKALTVLKEMVPGSLQNLCVAALDDSSRDMERSIDGITEYMSCHTSEELRAVTTELELERQDVIRDLAEVRKKLFAIISRESTPIVYGDEELSPSEAARFIAANAGRLSYIPGRVERTRRLPLTYDELAELYSTNEYQGEGYSGNSQNLPIPELLLKPEDFARVAEELQAARASQQEIAAAKNWTVESPSEGRIAIRGADVSLDMYIPRPDDVLALREEMESFKIIEPWQKAIAADGKSGGGYREQWAMLTAAIERTCAYAEDIITAQVGQRVQIPSQVNRAELKESCGELKSIIKNGNVSLLSKMLHSKYKLALEEVTINDHPLATAADCDAVMRHIELAELRERCGAIWDDLLVRYGLPRFAALDAERPELIAGNWVQDIHYYLTWYQKDYGRLLMKINSIGLTPEILFGITSLDNEAAAIDKLFSAVSYIPAVCDILLAGNTVRGAESQLTALRVILTVENRTKNALCSKMARAVNELSVAGYEAAYKEIARVVEGTRVHDRRQELLGRLRTLAPDWAAVIEVRQGLHGRSEVPADIAAAWKWKQLSSVIEEIASQPYSELQAESERLSSEYREITTEVAEKRGWYHLLARAESDIDMKQALQGWKQTMQKIGKGTGRLAPKYRAKARELMADCQLAVPVWIMPLNTALATLDPRQNRFDVVIIDEASQSDISALAVLYMGKKLIIVGDDRQVSPADIGNDAADTAELQQLYIEDKVPNAHLYSLKTSIYDIAATTFPSLLLREHFRCVPEIIGFSNQLSYNGNIKPLREASSSDLRPAVINYRVAGGRRDPGTKTNEPEARAIVALIEACLAEPEYAGKTFGVISLLGDEQVKLIQKLITARINLRTVKERRILCGNSASFQGDERDVIFISLVDSASGAPLRLLSYGADDMYRKRYNVAASRARDQLWVVNSLDATVDLKPTDLRRRLIEYVAAPIADETEPARLKRADSPLELEIAEELKKRGYNIVRQWQVGAYRIDMVACCGEHKIAIECDGERYHGGEARVREDMTRQTILERVGWNFIRIRGSEYYRDRHATIERLVGKLGLNGIYPESTASENSPQNSELLARIRGKVTQILREWIVSTPK